LSFRKRIDAGRGEKKRGSMPTKTRSLFQGEKTQGEDNLKKGDWKKEGRYNLNF